MDLTRFLSTHKSAAPDSGTPAKMIVGLGNPGPEYARNRHNVGFQVVDLFAGRHSLALDRFQKRARLGIGTVKLPGGNVKVLLAKPMTYMNLSGEAVGQLAAFYKIAAADILVISDDLDLPPGKLRLRTGGSAGGQKGVKSIVQHLHTEDFSRLRVGIGRPGGQGSAAPPGMDPADYVLQNFTAAEETEMGFVRPRAADAIETWLAEGIAAAMNRFNSDEGRKTKDESDERRRTKDA
jgi:peptidyl-tRNA hydrolase, PTH1 family